MNTIGRVRATPVTYALFSTNFVKFHNTYIIGPAKRCTSLQTLKKIFNTIWGYIVKPEQLSFFPVYTSSLHATRNKTKTAFLLASLHNRLTPRNTQRAK